MSPEELPGWHTAACLEGCGDVVGTYQHKSPDSVAIFVSRPGVGKLTIGLRPGEARKFAAAILNAADAIEGVTPLVFMPPSPDGEFPDGHPDK